MRRRPAGVVAADDRVDREHQRRRDGHGAGDVEPGRCARRRGARQERHAETEHGDADRQIDEEDPVPVVDVGEHAAEQHADRAPARADEAVHAHRLGALAGLGEERHQQRERHRVDDRAADALDGARDHERQLRARQAAGERGAGEEDDADHERAPVPVEIAEPAAEQQEAAAGQQVGVDDPDQRRLGEAEIGADRRQRDVDDGHVEHDHEHAEADDAEGEPAARGGERSRHREGERRRARMRGQRGRVCIVFGAAAWPATASAGSRRPCPARSATRRMQAGP